jgi:hypothetical protein
VRDIESLYRLAGERGGIREGSRYNAWLVALSACGDEAESHVDWLRRRGDAVTGLVHHSGRRTQYLAMR